MTEATHLIRRPGAWALTPGWPRYVTPDLSAGLLYDWWADDLTGSDGAAVTSWTDRVSGATLTLNYGAADLQSRAGHRYVRIPTAARFTLVLPTPITGDMSIVLSARLDASSGAQARLISGTSTAYRGFRRETGTPLRATTSNSIALGISPTDPFDNGWHVVAARFAAGGPVAGTTDLGGVTEGSSNADSVTISDLTVGAVAPGNPASPSGTPGAAGNLVGGIARLSVFARSLSNAELLSSVSTNRSTFAF